MNELQKLILNYPDKNWDWKALSANPNIDLEFIEKHPEFPWVWSSIRDNYKWVCCDSKLTLEFIKKHIDKKFDWNHISSSHIITEEFVLNNCNKFNWSWDILFKNPVLSFEFIYTIWDNMSSNDKDYYKIHIIEHPNTTMEHIEKWFPDDLNFYYISSNPNLTMEFIEKHSDWSWHWGLISDNKFGYAFKNNKFYQNRRKSKIKELMCVLPVIEDLARIILDYAVWY